MKIQSRISAVFGSALAFVMYAVPAFATEGNETGVLLKPSEDVINKAENPSPPADAQQKTSIGKDGLSVNTANSPDDTDSFWIQRIDIDGDGTPESANLIWDDEDKVLYYYYEGTIKCKNGQMASGAALIGVNGKDNPRKRPPGSGFFAVSLDKGECGAEEAGLWGCKFDASGNPTACGTVAINDKYDDIIIESASE